MLTKILRLILYAIMAVSLLVTYISCLILKNLMCARGGVSVSFFFFFFFCLSISTEVVKNLHVLSLRENGFDSYLL